MEMNYTYISIVSYETEEIVKRVDVTGKGERFIDKVERGMNINLDSENYFTRVVRSPTKLQPI